MTCTPTCVAPTPNQAHCGSGCHVTWSGVTGFDRHRRDGRCLTPDEIGYVVDSRGVYRAPITDAKRAQLAALRRRGDADSRSLSEPQSDRSPGLVVADVSGLPGGSQTRSGGSR